MAKKKKKRSETDRGAPGQERSSPLVAHAILWIGFLVVLAIGVVTVFVPEVTDDGSAEDGAGEDGAGEEGAGEEGSAEDGASEPADEAEPADPAAAAPTAPATPAP